ncbi:hypothetical protein V9T40_005460 [Parthenolecanium corni]|uniref:ABC transporter domain-containing protein n=1 Tax=Parthenolecanium corni TaxID=536013 RepID=A0AAN9Y327_9HEMI
MSNKTDHKNVRLDDKGYGLLGPSGCGKTTLLNCIAGRMTLDSGTVRLKITRRSELGYMPQDLSLHSGMSIMENFCFYGYIFGLEDHVIQARADELISFLDLPMGHRLVGELSGGQQRRISLAVTIFHDPKLMILDEPTVGLDPILSQSIWEYLLKMAASGKTIIITTHYIQEARQAHMIGLLRNGKLLAEDPPYKLMEKCSCDNLEEAFLKLSITQEDRDVEEEFYSSAPFQGFDLLALVFCSSYGPVKSVPNKEADKHGTEYSRMNERYLKNQPILIETPKHLHVAVINEEISLAECNYKNFSTGCFLDDVHNVPLSCLYLKFLAERTYELIEYNNKSLAIDHVNSNEVWGLLHFPRNYTDSFAHRFWNGTDVESDYVTGSFLDVYMDFSNRIIGTLMKQEMVLAMQSFLYAAMNNCGQNPKIISFPLVFQKPVFGSLNQEFISYSAYPFICICCFFLPSISTALRLYLEKSEGILERMIVNGVALKEMLISISIIQVGIHFVQYAIIMFIVQFTTDLVIQGSFLTLSILMLLVGVSGMLFGFILAIAFNNLMLISYSGMGATFILSFVSGLLSATETAHGIIRVMRRFMPVCWEIDSARSITVRGFPFTHPEVYQGFIASIVFPRTTIVDLDHSSSQPQNSKLKQIAIEAIEISFDLDSFSLIQ